MSDVYYFLNVPDIKVSLTTNEAAVITERNEIYEEVCLSSSMLVIKKFQPNL